MNSLATTSNTGEGMNTALPIEDAERCYDTLDLRPWKQRHTQIRECCNMSLFWNSFLYGIKSHLTSFQRADIIL